MNAEWQVLGCRGKDLDTVEHHFNVPSSLVLSFGQDIRLCRKAEWC